MQDYHNAEIRDKRILMRVDFNVPMRDGKIGDDTRMIAALEGIRYLQKGGAKTILLSHWGRPKGKHVPEMSLQPVAAHLAKLLGQEVHFIADMMQLPPMTQSMQAGDIALCENLRFHPGEEQNDKSFAQQLAGAGDIYINDAFSAAHRAHASTDSLAHLLPCFAGPLLKREVRALEQCLKNPRRPLAAIVGGAKISSKIALLQNLVKMTDALIITGGMANVFLKHQGIPIGRSLCEDDALGLAGEIKNLAVQHHTDIILPVDAVCASEIAPNAASRTITDLNEITDEEMILDAGDATLQIIKQRLQTAQTIIMNGPLGVFEIPAFARGTHQLCEYLANRAQAGVQVIAGGGDTVAAVNQSGYAAQFSYLSTAGGAFLEWLEGKTLPGIAALD